MSAKYEPIRRVVSFFCDQYKKVDEDRYFVMAYRGLENMHFNISAEPKTLRLPVEANQTVLMPPDYVSWVKIGLLNNNGEVSTLKVNNSLTTFRDSNPNRLSLLTPNITDTWIGNQFAPYFNYFANGEFQTLFGIGQAGLQQYGECRVDELNNLIILSPNFQYSDIILEYISCPEKDADYLVDIRLREALIAFIAWKCNLDTRQNFYAAQVEARRMIKPIRMQSFQETIRENERMTIKV